MAERFKIRLVDASDEYIRDTLSEMHDEVFEDTAPIPNFEVGDWWLASNGRELVGLCGITPSTYLPDTGYLKRAAVRQGYRGHGLQRRMIAARMRHASRLGYHTVFTDTAVFNVRSSTNLFKAGFELFRPDPIWNGEDFLYWRKCCA
jgi:RimJ/RimL family protein N-acetyltransferase